MTNPKTLQEILEKVKVIRYCFDNCYWKGEMKHPEKLELLKAFNELINYTEAISDLLPKEKKLKGVDHLDIGGFPFHCRKCKKDGYNQALKDIREKLGLKE